MEPRPQSVVVGLLAFFVKEETPPPHLTASRLVWFPATGRPAPQQVGEV